MFSLEFPDVLVYSAISLWIDTHPILNFLTKSARKKEERTKGPGDILVHVGEREGLPYIKRFFSIKQKKCYFIIIKHSELPRTPGPKGQCPTKDTVSG